MQLIQIVNIATSETIFVPAASADLQLPFAFGIIEAHRCTFIEKIAHVPSDTSTANLYIQLGFIFGNK